MDFYTLILLVGLCTIVAIGLWYKDWDLETFQVPRDLLATYEAPLEWVKSKLDHLARIGNSCRVLERFADAEVAGAFVEITDPTCESGLPHTAGKNTIRIPKSAWDASNAERRAAILRHERIHLLQRRKPEQWAEFYKKEWEYTMNGTPPEEIADADIRANPDTYPDRWPCWRGRYWFVPIYRSRVTPRLQDTDTRIWDAAKKEWLTQPPYEWRVQFCSERGECPYQSEHPAEISAEYATEFAKWTTPASMSLRRFLEQN